MDLGERMETNDYLGEVLAVAIEMNKDYDPEFEEFSYQILGEIAAVGSGFEDTIKLRVMKYNETMATGDLKKFLKYKFMEAVLWYDVPAAAKILMLTWEMKKKANRSHHAWLTVRGFEQLSGEHYHKNSIAAPVASNIVIRVIFVLMILVSFVGELIDIRR